MTIRVHAEPCTGRDLRPGDLFSVVGPEYWDHIDDRKSVGEKAYIRTNSPMDIAPDVDAPVFRLTVLDDDADEMLESLEVVMATTCFFGIDNVPREMVNMVRETSLELVRRIRGNRSDEMFITTEDVKLIYAAKLRFALTALERGFDAAMKAEGLDV